ncbi:MAG: flavodoxin family protein [Syntrophobacteraceae bacterium]
MKLLAIFGSPRKGGNTDLMMEAFLEGATAAAADLKVERVYVRELNMSGCRSCGYCDEHGSCFQKDDMQKVYPHLETADRVVIASPIYFYGLSGQAKLLVDRSQALFMRKFKRKKEGLPSPPPNTRKGFFLTAGATRGKRLFDCPILTARYFFDAIDVAYAGEVCFRQMEEKGAIRHHPTALDECREAGKEFVQAPTEGEH